MKRSRQNSEKSMPRRSVRVYNQAVKDTFFHESFLLQNMLLQYNVIDDVYKACSTSQALYKICQDKLFWIRWLKTHYPNMGIFSYQFFVNISIKEDKSVLFDALSSPEFQEWYVFDVMINLDATELLLVCNIVEMEISLNAIAYSTTFRNLWRNYVNTPEFWRLWSETGLLASGYNDVGNVLRIFAKYEKAKPFERDEYFQDVFVKRWLYTKKPTFFNTWRDFLIHVTTFGTVNHLFKTYSEIDLFAYDNKKTLVLIESNPERASKTLQSNVDTIERILTELRGSTELSTILNTPQQHTIQSSLAKAETDGWKIVILLNHSQDILEDQNVYKLSSLIDEISL